jgi:hypothetical protein
MKIRLKFHVLLEFLSFIALKFNIIYKEEDQKININIVVRFNGNIISDVINFKNEFLNVKLEIPKFFHNLDFNVVKNIDNKFYHRIEFLYIKNKINYTYFFAPKNFGNQNSEVDKISKLL